MVVVVVGHKCLCETVMTIKHPRGPNFRAGGHMRGGKTGGTRETRYGFAEVLKHLHHTPLEVMARVDDA
jgi:hypothetical protein